MQELTSFVPHPLVNTQIKLAKTRLEQTQWFKQLVDSKQINEMKGCSLLEFPVTFHLSVIMAKEHSYNIE